MSKILIVDDNEKEIRRPLLRQLGRLFGPEKLLEAGIATSVFPGDGRLTASFGVASFDSAENLLLQLAEDALNQAQIQGGGTVHLAELA
ncbi:MAG: hypothetical protein HQL64_12750 [Magnetococcales bacterium]|nr:hypothetical protein [Magnetococcales bacterium]